MTRQSDSAGGMKPPGTFSGVTIWLSPGYGFFQSCVWYQVKWFICAGLAKSARAPCPDSFCCTFQAFHWAATWASPAGTVADGAAAAVGSWAAGTSAPQDGGLDRPRVSEVRLGTAVNGV